MQVFHARCIIAQSRSLPLNLHRCESTMTSQPIESLSPEQIEHFLQLDRKEQSNHEWKASILRRHYQHLTPDLLRALCPFCDEQTLNEGLIVRSPNNWFLALYNIRPVFPGHSLIIPTSHISKFTDVPLEHVVEFHQFQRHVILALQQVYQTESFNTLLQEGEYSGQSIQHTHLHLIPRTKGDLPNEQDWLDFFQKHEHAGRILTVEERQAAANIIRDTYYAILERNNSNGSKHNS